MSYLNGFVHVIECEILRYCVDLSSSDYRVVISPIITPLHVMLLYCSNSEWINSLFVVHHCCKKRSDCYPWSSPPLEIVAAHVDNSCNGGCCQEGSQSSSHVLNLICSWAPSVVVLVWAYPSPHPWNSPLLPPSELPPAPPPWHPRSLEYYCYSVDGALLC